MISVPPRPDNCELEFLQLKVEDVAPLTGTYEIIGHVTLSEVGDQDPYQQRYRDIVRPRACAMGGEGVSIGMKGTGHNLFATGSAVIYRVVRKRQAPGAPPPPPQKF